MPRVKVLLLVMASFVCRPYALDGIAQVQGADGEQAEA